MPLFVCALYMELFLCSAVRQSPFVLVCKSVSSCQLWCRGSQSTHFYLKSSWSTQKVTWIQNTAANSGLLWFILRGRSRPCICWKRIRCDKGMLTLSCVFKCLFQCHFGVCQSVSLFFCLCLRACPSLLDSACQSDCVYVCPCLRMPVCLSDLFACLSTCMHSANCMATCLPASQLVSKLAHHPPSYLPTCLPISLCVHPSHLQLPWCVHSTDHHL